MPTYQIQAPDGKTYRIDGPVGASQDQVRAQVLRQHPQAGRAVRPSTASRLLGGAGAVAKDVASFVTSPKEWGRTSWHAVTDLAGETLKSAATLTDWVADEPGYKDAPFHKLERSYASLERHVGEQLESERLVREPQTATGSLIQGVSQWTLGMATGAKELEALEPAGRVAASGLVMGTMFDPHAQGLSDLIQKYPQLRNPVTQFMSLHPGDSEGMARVRNAVAGLVGGAAAEGFIKALGVLKNAAYAKRNLNAFKLPDTPLVKHEDLGQGQHVLRTANGEMQLQEQEGSLQIKHVEVDKGARRKGEGGAMYSRARDLAQARGVRLESDTGVSPDAAKRWKALGARENPHTISPHTGNLVSSDPRKGVFEIGPTDEELEARGRQEATGEVASRLAAGQEANLPGQLSKGVERAEKAVAPSGASPTPTARMEAAFSRVPIPAQLKGYLQETGRWLQRTFAPESISEETRRAGSAIMEAVTRNAQHTSEVFLRAPARREYWEVNPANAFKIISAAERGRPLSDPLLERARDFYARWAAEMAEGDKEHSISYKEQSAYIPRMFENEEEVEKWIRKGGMKEAGFQKDRSFELLEQALAAGYKLRYRNLEDMFQARQHASDIARARVDTMKTLAREGLATEVRKPPEGIAVQELGVPEEKAETRPAGVTYSTPDGKTYVVHDSVVRDVLLRRMFDERSLWTLKNPVGSVYRGLMTLKNNLIPVKLAFSLFHPIHVLSMHMDAGLARSIKLGKWEMSHYSEGSRLLQLLSGKIPAKDWTEQDRTIVNAAAEGGLRITQDPRYRTQAVGHLNTALQRNSVLAVPHLFTAGVQTIQNLMFQKWIPSLKAASYLADARALLRSRPELMSDSGARRTALRGLAKSVENRYGEMNYNSLFWPRYLRDVSVLSTLSMGWQLGLLREYGGGAGQLARLVGRPGEAWKMLRKGELDKLLYVANYTLTAGLLGGLMTWAMTGQHPKGAEDYLAPRIGETNPDGTPARSRTMFYPYEFLAQTKRFEHEGVFAGLKDLAESKGSGVFEMISEGATGVNSLGQEIRDPNSSAFQQVKQTLEGIAKDWAPISLENRGQQSTKQKVLDVLGFTPAPRYLQQTSGEAAIEQTYDRYYRAGVEPFVTAAKSDLRKQLKAAYAAKDDDKTNKILTQMMTQYGLRAQDVRRMFRDIASGKTAYQQMFEHFTLEQQEAVLRKMKPEERKQYEKFVSARERARLAQAGY